MNGLATECDQPSRHQRGKLNTWETQLSARLEENLRILTRRRAVPRWHPKFTSSFAYTKSLTMACILHQQFEIGCLRDLDHPVTVDCMNNHFKLLSRHLSQASVPSVLSMSPKSFSRAIVPGVSEPACTSSSLRLGVGRLNFFSLNSILTLDPDRKLLIGHSQHPGFTPADMVEVDNNSVPDQATDDVHVQGNVWRRKGSVNLSVGETDNP